MTSSLRTSLPSPLRQHGLGLVEILVGLTIALFLLAGLFVIFNSTRTTSQEQGQLAALQDNQRLAMTMLANTVQLAGYYPDPVNNAVDAMLPVSGSFASNGQSVVGTSGATATDPDTLTVRFVAPPNDQSVINCQGGTNATGVNVTYVNQIAVDTRDDTLRCNMNGSGSQPLVDGVANLKVLYGIDPTNTGSVTQYVDSTGVADWNAVRNLRVTLCFDNPLRNTAAIGGCAVNQIPFTRVINLIGQGQT